MNPTDKFLHVLAALQKAGLQPLVMGGHAVRYYGVDRNTLDFDFHLSVESAAALEKQLLTTGLFPNGLVEGPSWRKEDFRRFQIGTLPDGREEWLEFWLHNHLLDSFPELWRRREDAVFGDITASFLSLPDLIHSKETERESDWQDVALLEEILDLRRLAQAREDSSSLAALSGLRSRRGFERALAAGLFADSTVVRQALHQAGCLISQAYLLPFAPDAERPAILNETGSNTLNEPLRHVAPGSARHFALVEAARRFHKQAASAADRADKEKHLKR
ncbi:MAG: hypothetical protein AB1705_06490 [Verrucomicrobiota bacterium]